jgi:hypothetical protein
LTFVFRAIDENTRIVLKRLFKKWHGGRGAWIELIWLRIWIGGGPL